MKKRRFKGKRGDSGESGQVSAEYMMAIAVIVIAVVAAAFVFVPPFRQGMENWADGFTTWYGKKGTQGYPEPQK